MIANTGMPHVLAASSLSRTACIARPNRVVRSRHTATATHAITTRHSPRYAFPASKLIPNRCGRGMLRTPSGPCVNPIQLINTTVRIC